jgi:hypothetical protein
MYLTGDGTERFYLAFWWRFDEWMLHWFFCRTCRAVWLIVGPFELYFEP